MLQGIHVHVLTQIPHLRWPILNRYHLSHRIILPPLAQCQHVMGVVEPVLNLRKEEISLPRTQR